MTTKEVTLKLKVDGDAPGMKKAQQGGQKLVDTLGKSKTAVTSFAALDKTAGRAAHQIAGLAGGVKKLNDLFKNLGDIQSVAELKRQLADTTKEVERLTAAKKKDHDEDNRRKDQQANRRSFGMGVMQGAGVGEYFPEKGLRANLAGRMVGGMARWGAGALATPFTGAQGFAQSLGGIPGVGGFLSAQMGQGTAYAGKYLEAQRQMTGMAQFQGFGAGGAARAAGDRAAKGVGIAGLNPKAAALAGDLAAQDAALLQDAGGSTSALPTTGHQRLKERTRRKMEALKHGGLKAMAQVADSFAAEGLNSLEDPEAARARATAAEDKAQRNARSDSLERRKEARQEAERRVRENPFTFMRAEGLKYGMGPTAARQAGGEFIGAMGGTFDQLGKGGRGRSLFQTGLAAQTMGIDMSTTAAFGRAGRTGAMSEGRDPNAAFMDTMKQGIKLGLEGSDLTRYMAQAAQALSEFEQTGMPLNQDALGALQSDLAGSFGSIRGNVISQGLLAAGRNIAQNGASTPAQLMMLQEMGGFRGGGIDQYFDAQSRLEGGDFQKGGLESFLKRSQLSTSDKGNAILVQDALQQLGVHVGAEEAKAYVSGDRNVLKRWQDQLSGGSKRAEGMTADTYAKEVQGLVPEGMKRAALEEGGEEDVGRRLLGSVQDLNQASMETSKNFSKFSEQVRSVTDTIEHAAKNAGPFFDKLEEFVQKVLRMPG